MVFWLPLDSMIWLIQPAICFIWGSLKPRVVVAGVPRRKPEVIMGDLGSLGIPFLLVIKPAASSHCSASLPVRSGSFSRRETSMRWFSVPPLVIRKPRDVSSDANACAFLMTCFW